MPADDLLAALEEIRLREQSRDVPVLVAAVEAVLKLAGEWADGEVNSYSALTEDRDWVRAECGRKLREAAARALLGEKAPGE